MNGLLDLFAIIALTALAVTAIGVVLIRRILRRLCRTLRARIGAVSTRTPYAVASQPAGGRRYIWSASASPLAVDRLAVSSIGPVLAVGAWLPGRDRAIWKVRRDLHRDISGTTRLLRAARQSGRPLPELERGVAMLARHERALQLDLQVIAAELDRTEQSRLLRAHAERKALIRNTCADVRAAVLCEGSSSNQAALHRIVADIQDALTAAHFRGRAYQDLSRL
jgi:hypothetical protein